MPVCKSHSDTATCPLCRTHTGLRCPWQVAVVLSFKGGSSISHNPFGHDVDRLRVQGASESRIRDALSIKEGTAAQQQDAGTEDGKDRSKEGRRRQAGRNLIASALVAVIGAAVTGGTYLTAAPGETYFVTFGAFILCIFLLVKAIWYLVLSQLGK